MPSAARRQLATIGLLIACSSAALAEAPRAGRDWPQFRGIAAGGVSDGATLPHEWQVGPDGSGEHVAWRTPIPGLAHSSPVVWGDRVYVTSAIPASATELKVGLYGAGDSAEDMIEHDWVVICLDKGSGRVLWQRSATRGVPQFKRHTKATHCNSSPATDGDKVVAFFGAEGLFCFSSDGELLWQKDLGPLDVGPHNGPELQWGFASSPVIAGGRVIVQCDVKGDSFLAAYDLADGRELWRVPRTDVPGWCTPTVVENGAYAQIIANGCRDIGGYQLSDGTRLWSLAGGGGVPVPAPVVSGDVVFLTSNHRPIKPSDPQKPIFAVKLGSRGEIPTPSAEQVDQRLAWFSSGRGNYMQTPLVYRGVAYFCNDNGSMAAFDEKTGQELYRERVSDGVGFTASAVAGDGKVYFTSEEGDVYILQAGREFTKPKHSSLGEICMATPAISEGLILFRTRDHLVAVGKK